MNLKRYKETAAGMYPAPPDEEGPWVQYDDVEAMDKLLTANATAIERLTKERDEAKQHATNCDKRIENQRNELAHMQVWVKDANGWIQAYREALGRDDGLTAIKEMHATLTANADVIRRLRELCAVRVLCGRCGRVYVYNKADGDNAKQVARDQHDIECQALTPAEKEAV